MFCTAFYSYKGGVGRTLALANVAVVLAKKNRRVLVVDFDLEAPGLTTLAAFRDAAERRGLVDFVQEYLKTGEVPSVAEYIQKCEVIDPQTTLTLEIHVMPAGRLDDGYPQRFAAIDWAKLYEVQDGFLLMEDLRVQWAAAGYDYVLIDSRTGLTDIGGICTRQLPDVVVAVFFPNEQNLAGLKQVVPSIREQGARPRPIDVLFAASRVPRLDDEHGVLRTWLAKFRSELSYDETRLTIIEHYDSLSLLDQTLFVLDRPNSGLAHQYEELAAAISQQNVEDADGVLRFLHDARAQLQDNLARRTPPQQTAGVGQPEEEALLKRMEAISKFHQRDYVVQWALAQVYHQLRRLVDAAIATDQALSAVDYTRTTDPVPRRIIPSIHRLRIRIFNELGDMDEVAQSAEQVLNDPGASDLMALDALLALSSADPSRLPHPDKLPALDGADRDRLIAVARRLSASPPASQIAAAIAERALYADGGVEELSEEDMHHLQLVLLAGGRFAAAAAIGERAVSLSPDDVVDLFNTAMARWGRDKEPDLGSFSRIDELLALSKEDPTDANPHECHALVLAVLKRVGPAGERADVAIEKIRASKRRELSCWNYFTVPPNEFEQHCEAIKAFAAGEGEEPEFLRLGASTAV